MTGIQKVGKSYLSVSCVISFKLKQSATLNDRDDEKRPASNSQNAGVTVVVATAMEFTYVGFISDMIVAL